jgi:hypothetical protein
MSKWTKEAIANLIATDNRALERAILAIHARQTADEKQHELTTHLNGKGFRPQDAKFLSSLAGWINVSAKPQGERLSVKQQEWARKRMTKYASQLLRVIKEKEVTNAQITLPIT